MTEIGLGSIDRGHVVWSLVDVDGRLHLCVEGRMIRLSTLLAALSEYVDLKSLAGSY